MRAPSTFGEASAIGLTADLNNLAGGCQVEDNHVRNTGDDGIAQVM